MPLKKQVELLQNQNKMLESRITSLEKRNIALGFNQLGGRIDYRLTRLEILSWYHFNDRYEQLDDERKEILRYIEEDTLQGWPRKFFPEKYDFDGNCKSSKPQFEIDIVEDGRFSVWKHNGKRIYFPYSKELAHRQASGLYREFFTHSPHNYFDEDYTVGDIPEGSIVADVGAAEGLFGMTVIDRCKKVYLFEYENKWIEALGKTYSDYSDKIEIIPELVGDGEKGLSLDEFFKDKEKPNLVKMDVEGYEASILKGMKNMLEESFPLTMLICTYHRQHDWDHYYDFLQKRFEITHSKGWYWHMPDPMPPFFRRGIMRAIRK